MMKYEFKGNKFEIDLSKYDDKFKIDFLSDSLKLMNIVNNELKDTISQYKSILTQLTLMMCIEKPEKKENKNERT